MNAQGRLISRFTQGLGAGELIWIGLREQRKGQILKVDQAQALAGFGLEGDHRCGGTEGSARQVTLISSEYIRLIETYLDCENISPERLRRNLVVSGINLNALRHQRFRIGEAEFEATAHCHPCSRMEKELGKGGVAAMLGHGGICARIVQSGLIRVGDSVQKLDKQLDD
ncbi:MAG: MOSC domain-containing protein [Motiliproteus sp.]|nr:MOSC domain-containing protein [Motiliproteus sp.]MCW9054104.1 MOSC domain-containing protein [Motiliproteus sp.]